MFEKNFIVLGYKKDPYILLDLDGRLKALQQTQLLFNYTE